MDYKKCKDGNSMCWGRDIRAIGENCVGCDNISLYMSEICKNKKQNKQISIYTCNIKG